MCKEKQIGFSFIDLLLFLLCKLAEDPIMNRTFTDFAPTLHRLWYGGRAEDEGRKMRGVSWAKDINTFSFLVVWDFFLQETLRFVCLIFAFLSTILPCSSEPNSMKVRSKSEQIAKVHRVWFGECTKEMLRSLFPR